MLNSSLGDRCEIDGIAYLRMRRGAHGHALYGPYEQRAPGRYAVEFSIAAAEDNGDPEDSVCGFVDVAAESGRRIVAQGPVWTSQLRDGAARIRLPFEIDQPLDLEYRVYANGTVPLLVADQAIVRDAGAPGEAAAGADRDPVVRIGGIRINAGCYDDLHFVDEIFYHKTYNMLSARDACVVDIGMNVGLATLLFAKMANVREIHAFEPFPETYARGLANLRLNPDLAAKVRTYNVGLADGDEEAAVAVDDGDSGGMSIHQRGGGSTIRLSVRDAAATLAPIVANARGRGLQVIAKVDCEGSEFDIFASLARADLFRQMTALLVEWHRVFEGRSQNELLAPLLAAGFIVIDISPDEGNGFFYAVRAAD